MPVVLHVEFCCFARVMLGVFMMPTCAMRVVGRRFVIAGFVVLRGFAVMPRRVLVMLRGFMVMLGCLFRHRFASQAKT
jgi:hypothetical protein